MHRLSRLISNLLARAPFAVPRGGRAAGQEPRVMGFCGYGTPERAVLPGRVLLPNRAVPVKARQSRLRNFLNIIGLAYSRELPGVSVTGTLGGGQASATTDAEGYFQLEFRFSRPLADGWHEASVRLPGLAPSTAPVRIAGPAEFGVISDMDDTVIVTGVTRFWQMVRTVLFGNARTRLPFPGVSELYRALAAGPGGTARNPLFYVSSSPWNFFGLLWAFLQHRDIPRGAMFLRDWGWNLLSMPSRRHKLAAIERIFAMYPQLPFVLLGDSGEQDPEIYAEVTRRHPERILAVYIRSVGGAERAADVQRLREELRAHHRHLVLAPDSLAAAHHAYALGLINWRGVREVGLAT